MGTAYLDSSQLVELAVDLENLDGRHESGVGAAALEDQPALFHCLSVTENGIHGPKEAANALYVTR